MLAQNKDIEKSTKPLFKHIFDQP